MPTPSLQVHDNPRAANAQCWTTQLLLLLSFIVLALLDAAVRDDFTSFLFDPGTPGWRFLCGLVPVYALMPVLVRTCEGRWFRWLNTALSGLTLLFPISHQIRHISQGKPWDVSVAVEFAMVFVTLLGTWTALRWARGVDPALPPACQG